MKAAITFCLILLSTVVVSAQQSQARPRVTERHSLNSAQTQEAERHLDGMGYWTGAVDGVFDSATEAAVTAFQKWQSRPVTGKLTLEELEGIRISAARNNRPAGNSAEALNANSFAGTRGLHNSSGPPRARETGYAHVEIDVDRQVMLIINADESVRVLPVSTGNDKPFMEDGQQSIAYTPRGRFLVYDKSDGWEKGYLGSMYYSNYISGGVAIHGHPNVPSVPASHGCIRIPMFAAREVSRLLKLGTIVLVYDKVSFVSAKDWVENPELKEAAMALSGHWDYVYYRPKNEPKPAVIKKARPKITRAD